MKQYISIFRIKFLLLVTLLGLISCRWEEKEEPAPQPPPPTIYEPNPNAAPTEGQLVVYIFGGSRYIPVANTEIRLYLNQEDFQNNLPLAGRITDNNGRADFGYLNFGNYYVYAFKRVDNQDMQRTEVGQVQAGKTLTKNIILY